MNIKLVKKKILQQIPTILVTSRSCVLALHEIFVVKIFYLEHKRDEIVMKRYEMFEIMCVERTKRARKKKKEKKEWCNSRFFRNAK